MLKEDGGDTLNEKMVITMIINDHQSKHHSRLEETFDQAWLLFLVSNLDPSHNLVRSALQKGDTSRMKRTSSLSVTLILKLLYVYSVQVWPYF